MIVSCPSCSARYKFDEEKLKGRRAAKITCPRCRHVFVVRSADEEDQVVSEDEEQEFDGGDSTDIFTADFRRLGTTWHSRRDLDRHV